MTKLCIFASGAGSNAANIIKFFADSKAIEVALVVCNRKNAGVIQRCADLGVEVEIMANDTIAQSTELIELLKSHEISWIALAGFLRKIPSEIIQLFPDRIVNLHPSLLPKFGGKGMYGHHVHQAVYESGEVETGITIHMVSQQYDEGAVIKQVSTSIDSDDSPETIEQKVRDLELNWFPRVIEDLILKAKN